MKRLFFIFGTIIILALFGVLLFLLLQNPSGRNDIFSAFNFGDTETGESPLDALLDVFTPETGNLTALRQLSLKRVIGVAEPVMSSTEPRVYFVEAGTGYVFSQVIMTGEETRLSNITIPLAHKAVFSRDAQLVAIASKETGGGSTLTVVTLPYGTSTLGSFTIDELVFDFSLSDDGYLLYTTKGAAGVLGKQYDLRTKVTTILFELPFREAVVRWGHMSTDNPTVYQKPAASLEGYAYKMIDGVLSRLPITGYGLSLAVGSSSILYATSRVDGITSYATDPEMKRSNVLPLSILPEKCAFLQLSPELVCAYDEIPSTTTFPDNWYKGLFTFADELWRINLTDQSATQILDFAAESGRPLDVVHLVMSADDVRLYFINKTDESLWLYDRSLAFEPQ
jgi:hypothetical protein